MCPEASYAGDDDSHNDTEDGKTVHLCPGLDSAGRYLERVFTGDPRNERWGLRHNERGHGMLTDNDPVYMERVRFCPACGEKLALESTEVPKLVGPFPQEPAFGSPEAVAQAAETIRHAPDVSTAPEMRFASSIGEEIILSRVGDVLILTGEEERRPKVLRMGPETVLGTALLAAYERECALEARRDELADALEALRRQFPRSYDPNDAKRQFGLGDPLSGVELASLDALLRKAGRS